MSVPSPAEQPAAGTSAPWLARWFCAWVIALAVLQFSENTVDPDLFGHIAFGRQAIRERTVQKTETYSWTARGQPFINHEHLADVVLAAVHYVGGGTGLLLLKVGVGLFTFLVAVRLGGADLRWPERAWAWAVGAVAVVELSFGFAARPQIFTAAFLVVEIWLLRRIHAGRHAWAIALPPLFTSWINLHGGALAGLGLLGLSATVTTAALVWAARSSPDTTRADWRLGAWLWAATLGSLLASACNPWGFGLLRWLITSVTWLRPEIAEWNPTPVGWDHAAFFLLALATLAAWTGTTRPRAPWELAATLAFLALGVRANRNAPLFAAVALSIIPPHLASAASVWARETSRLRALCRTRAFQRLLSLWFGLATVGTAIATFTLHKQRPLTMEIPRRQYPMAALRFLEDHGLQGNLLTFFDWGDLCLYRLTNCAPSIDGRLDAAYSRELIRAHWRFYNGEPMDRERLLDPARADLALLPVALAGAAALAKAPGWKAVYFDDVAVLLVRDPGRFPRLAGLTRPVEGPPEAGRGREPFPREAPCQRDDKATTSTGPG